MFYGYYFKRADLLSKIYARDGRYMPAKRKKLYRNTAVVYAEILGESDFEPSEDQIIFKSGNIIQRICFYLEPVQWDDIER